MMSADLIYFSSVSENTHRFANKLELKSIRIPVQPNQDTIMAEIPYVLLLPTYGSGNDSRSVPKQVIRFLNVESNRNLIRGVIASGNTNFGKAYCLAGRVVAQKCNVPLLYKFELFGTPEDVDNVTRGLDEFWKK